MTLRDQTIEVLLVVRGEGGSYNKSSTMDVDQDGQFLIGLSEFCEVKSS